MVFRTGGKLLALAGSTPNGTVISYVLVCQ